jgi:hypothetical protein
MPIEHQDRRIGHPWNIAGRVGCGKMPWPDVAYVGVRIWAKIPRP